MTSIKKIISVLSALILAASLISGCGDKKDIDRMTYIKTSGKIMIATEGTWIPWTYKDETGELTGFDVELAEAIAKKMGVKVMYFEGNFDTLLNDVASGRYDIMTNGVEITDERKEKMDFSRPYAYMKTALVVAESNTNIKSFNDLKGKTVANSYGTSYGDIAEKLGAEIKSMSTVEQRMDALISGEADASINSEYSIYSYLEENPDTPIKIVDFTEDVEEIAIPLHKGEDTEALKNEVNRILDELEKDGTLTELSNKYFGKDITKPDQ